jgi:hypothetical protein
VRARATGLGRPLEVRLHESTGRGDSPASGLDQRPHPSRDLGALCVVSRARQIDEAQARPMRSLRLGTRTHHLGDRGETPARPRELGSPVPRRGSSPGPERPRPVSPRESSTGRSETAERLARESSRVHARDERFAADADRVDRIRGDRFGDGANRSRASQLTRATPAIRATESRGRPSSTIDPGPRSRPTRREAIARRMPLALSSSACASPG